MKNSGKKAVAVGAGLAALAAGVAATYFFTGKGGAKNRKKVSTWAGKAKKEVLKEIKAAEVTSQNAYNKVVDSVLKNYKNLKNVDTSEISAMAAELKGHWKSISSQVKKMAPKKAPVKKANASSKRK